MKSPSWMGCRRGHVPLIRFAGGFLLCLLSGNVQAQSASLLYRQIPPPPNQPVTMKDVSLIRQLDPVIPKLHDLVNITIDEKIFQRNNAQANRRKSTAYVYALTDWVDILSGLRLRADQAIRSQRPSIAVSSLNNMQSQYQFFRNDRLTATIQAEVVEIKPNGNLVIEANGIVAVNNEQNTYKISGVINPLDIDPKTRAISSDKIASKRVELFQVGPTRDGYRRGWMVRALDMFLPF